MYKKLLPYLLALFIVMPLHAEETEEIESSTPSKKDASLIQDAVKLALKDPESAKFRTPIMMESKHGKGACIQVNSKNSFGGYSGFQTAMVFKLENTWVPTNIDDNGMDFCKILLSRVLQTDEWKNL